MASAVEFIVYFENPSLDVEILGDQVSERLYQLTLFKNIDTANRRGDISQLEHLLCSRLGRIQVLLGWIPAQNRDCQPNRQLYIVVAYCSWDYVRLLSLNQIFDLLQSLRTV